MESSRERIKVGQSRTQSAIEAVLNVAIGISVGAAANAVVLPAFGYAVTLAEIWAMSGIFSAISLVRSYFVRRLFNWLHLRS